MRDLITSLFKTFDILGMIYGSILVLQGEAGGWIVITLSSLAYFCFDLSDRGRFDTKEVTENDK